MRVKGRHRPRTRDLRRFLPQMRRMPFSVLHSAVVCPTGHPQPPVPNANRSQSFWSRTSIALATTPIVRALQFCLHPSLLIAPWPIEHSSLGCVPRATRQFARRAQKSLSIQKRHSHQRWDKPNQLVAPIACVRSGEASFRIVVCYHVCKLAPLHSGTFSNTRHYIGGAHPCQAAKSDLQCALCASGVAQEPGADPAVEGAIVGGRILECVVEMPAGRYAWQSCMSALLHPFAPASHTLDAAPSAHALRDPPRHGPAGQRPWVIP